MPQWEYLHLETAEDRIFIIAGDRREDWASYTLQDVLNVLGEDGWELVTMGFESAVMLPAHLIFKRAR